MKRCLLDESGNAAVEYTVLVITLTLLVMGGYRAVGDSLPILFNKVGVVFAATP
jgi:Flp pilus assembly pilin Flp